MTGFPLFLCVVGALALATAVVEFVVWLDK